jgi:hypothetical protein
MESKPRPALTDTGNRRVPGFNTQMGQSIIFYCVPGIPSFIVSPESLPESPQRYYYRVVQLAWKWLNQRSQQRSYNWDEFRRLLRYNPLPRPRLCHGYPKLTRMYA